MALMPLSQDRPPRLPRRRRLHRQSEVHSVSGLPVDLVTTLASLSDAYPRQHAAPPPQQEEQEEARAASIWEWPHARLLHAEDVSAVVRLHVAGEVEE